jgi:integrase
MVSPGDVSRRLPDPDRWLMGASVIGGQRSQVIITGWRQYLTAAGQSPNTIAVKCRYVLRLAAEHDVCAVTGPQLVAWVAGHAWARETRKSARAALRGFYAWAVPEHRPDNPALALPAVEVPPPCPRPAPDSVFRAALSTATGPELLMVQLAGWCGMRRAEIAAVHTADLVDDAWLRVTGKGGRTRIVPLPATLAVSVRAADGWLFPGRFPGTHVGADHVGRRLSRLLGPGWTGHGLRHRFATHAYSGSRDLLAVQQLLGHASPETTQRYVAVMPDTLAVAAAWAA